MTIESMKNNEKASYEYIHTGSSSRPSNVIGFLTKVYKNTQPFGDTVFTRMYFQLTEISDQTLKTQSFERKKSEIALPQPRGNTASMQAGDFYGPSLLDDISWDPRTLCIEHAI